MGKYPKIAYKQTTSLKDFFKASIKDWQQAEEHMHCKCGDCESCPFFLHESSTIKLSLSQLKNGSGLEYSRSLLCFVM